MRRILFILVLTMLPGLAFAAGDNHSKFSIFGFYGLGMVNPTDLNNLQKSATFSAPKPNDITSGYSFGGGLTMALGQKFQLKGSYNVFEGKNLATNSQGYTITQNMGWLDLDYLLVHTGRMYVYTGAGVGYPLTSHAKQNIAGAVTEFDADKTLGYNAEIGLGFMLGNHFSIFFQGGYEYVITGNLKNVVGGAPLLNTSSVASKMDLSGAKGIGGLAIMF